jgi:O-antigen/teichoic acid export membrane protein
MIGQSLIYFLVRAGNGVLSIATLVVFTRILSPEEYGVYALGMAMATMLSAILYQWLNVAVSRFYPPYEDNPEVIMPAVAFGFWMATAIALLLFLAALPFDKIFEVKSSLFGILFLIVVALGRYNLALQIANTQRDSLRFGLLSWTRGAITFLIGFALIHYGAGARGVLLGFLAGVLISVLIFSPKPRLKMKLHGDKTNKFSDMFRFGLPLSINFFAIVIVDMADRFIIGWLLGTNQVAPYVVAYELVQQLIGPIMNVLFLAAFPVIVKALEVDGDEAARIRLHTLGRGLVGVGLPCIFGLAVLSGDICELAFGSAFRQDATKIMPWLASAIFLGCFKSYFFDVVFQLRQVTKHQVYIALLMAFTNVILNFLLLPKYGVVAAAWSTFATFAVGLFLSWYIGKSIFSLPRLSKDFLGAMTASALMAIALFLLPAMNGIAGLLVKIIFGMIVYFIFAWIFNAANFRNYFGEMKFPLNLNKK